MRIQIALAAGVTAALLLGSAPAAAGLRPPGELLPDGDERPTMISAKVDAPQRHNELLEADIAVTAEDNNGISGYEYKWNEGPVLSMDMHAPVISYATAQPNAAFDLYVRAIDTNGWRSEWFTAWSGITPAPPNLVVAGDSIASGFSRQWFTGDASCIDPGYSYGQTVQNLLATGLPDAWAPTYVNVAWPGAGVGHVVDGGTDACSRSHVGQVASILTLTHPATWNVVVVTAGINSTNWGDVVIELTKDTAFSFTDRGDQAACRSAVSERWDIEQRSEYIADRTDDVAHMLATATNAKLFWTSYYSVSGSHLAPGWTPIGAECEVDLDLFLDKLHGAIRAGLSDDVTWIDITAQGVDAQMWAGWPHPSSSGHEVIGRQIAAAIQQ